MFELFLSDQETLEFDPDHVEGFKNALFMRLRFRQTEMSVTKGKAL